MAMHTNQHNLQLFLLILLTATIAALEPRPNCQTNCGSLRIPYPFGTSAGCYLDDSFFVNCTHNLPYLPNPNGDIIRVLNISIDGELLVPSPIVRDCYSKNGSILRYNLTHFSVSPNRNKFTAIGCGTLAVFAGKIFQTRNVTAGACVSVCNGLDEIINGSCSNTGCCQSPISKALSAFGLGALSNLSEYFGAHDFNPCGYAFIVEDGAYNFSSTDLRNFENRTLPMVLDWAVGNQTCEEAKQNRTGYACKAGRSACHNSSSGIGYRCKCLSGFQGNPYLPDGCKDIKECDMKPSPCSRICHELDGDYKCSCPEGYRGDGQRNGTGCLPKGKSSREVALIIAMSLSLSMLILLVGSLYLYRRLRKRMLNKIRDKRFQQNGGKLLQERLATQQGSTERAAIFSAQELKKATNNYDDDRVIGKGGHGTVYKGVLSDNRVVAIKKSKISSQSEIEQFINEVVVLSQINHRNIVKLLGCCLETEVPLLVYEFVSNGTLFYHIHIEGQASQLPWSIRLRIATETAEALAYLHSAASTPIIHRDVKTVNILLDDNLTAKVSDFGSSKLVPVDQTQLTTLVEGTLGYLDPEYFQTSHLSKKSDVYSFGVVLAELLTSMKAFSFARPESDRNLSMYFVSSLEDGRLPQILDNHIVNDANIEQIINVANLAKRCLMLEGQERPTMKEVARELERIRITEEHSLGLTNLFGEVTEYSLKGSEAHNVVDNGDGSGCSSSITGFFSIQSQILEPPDDGR